ncbi:MAG: dihydroorotate dehydrogenase electron transfer subunit [bacterium]
MSVKTLENATVVSHRQIRERIVSLWLRAPRIAGRAHPGQFVHVRVSQAFQPLLRRPISIGRVHGDELELVWRIVGAGTEILARAQPDDVVDLLGPLGRPFTIDPNVDKSLLVGGGLGAPPVVYLYERLKSLGKDASLIVGARSRADLPLADDDPLLRGITVVTEAKDKHFRTGLATEPLMELLSKRRNEGALEHTAVYSCGPWGLVGALQKTIPRGDLKVVEVSLEQQMGCGVGVCQGCAVVAEGGPTPYRLTCSDGPVFDLFSVEVPGVL